MRTTLLKKMSAVVLATLMVVAMFAGMAFSTAAVDADTMDITVAGKKTVNVSATDGAIVEVDDVTTTVTIYLNSTASTDTALWAKKGDYVQVKLANGEAINMTAGTTKVALGYKYVTVPMKDSITAVEALNAGMDTVKFYGFEFALTDGTNTAYYTKGDVTWADGTLNFTKFIPAGNVTLTVTGPNITDGVSTGRKAAANKGTFRASIAYKEAAADTFFVKTLEKAAPAADTTTEGATALNVTTGAISFGDKTGDAWLKANGMILTEVKTVDGIAVIKVDMKNNLIDETPVKFTVKDAAIASKGEATFTATDYNQTFTVALTDGTYGLVRFSATTNYDTDEAFTADMLVDLVKASAFRSLKGLTLVTDDGILVDMINAVVGQSNKYINWTLKKDSKTEYENKGFSVKTGTTKYTQADVNKKIALFGYFTEADGSITSKVQNYWGSFGFYEPNDIPGYNDKFTGVKDLYTGSATVLVYNDGAEDIQAILYHHDPATVLPIEMNGVTYNVPVFHITRSANLKAFAVGTAATQQVATAITNAGSYSYSLTGSELGLSKLVKEETKIALTLTSKVQLSHALNALTAAADADITLVLRAPKGTTFTTSTNSTTTITWVEAAAATALTTTDGLVDYYFNLSYNTYADTTATIKMIYANGTWKEIDVKTTWLTTDKAIEGFTATIPASTADLVTALPERPVESQEEPSVETPVSSSTATPVESTPASSSTGSDLEVPGTGNPFSAVAYLITICASAIGGISTLVIRKKK